MKIGLAQLNPVIGNFELNKSLILEASYEAKKKGAEWLLTPECSICGYPPKDLLFQSDFINQSESTLTKLANEVALPVVVGAPRKSSNGKLFNSAILIRGKKTSVISDKKLLPNYEVFDETRYFDSGNGPGVFEINGLRVGVAICEDFWSGRESNKLYLDYSLDSIKDLDIDILAGMHATPFRIGRPARQSLLNHEFSNGFSCPVISAHQIGGNDDLIFGGAGGIYWPGSKANLLGHFFEGVKVFDVNRLYESDLNGKLTLEEEVLQSLALGVKDYCKKTNHKKVVIGLSGGIDSALVASIAAAALGPESVCCVRMPSMYTSNASNEDALEITKRLGIEDLRTIPIETLHKEMRCVLKTKSVSVEGLTDENIQARLRGLCLMAISNSENRLLLSTGNKSELAVGYSTLYGDMCGAISVIGDLYKSIVYKCARALNSKPSLLNFSNAPLPSRVIERPPSAELRPDQIDQDSLPPYNELDSILFELIEMSKSIEEVVKVTGSNESVVKEVYRMLKLSEYKRFQAPVVLKVTSLAFGPGRRVPIARG